MFGTHNIALSGNVIYIISSPNFISYIFDKKYLKIYFHNTLQSFSHLVKYNTIINEKCNGGLQLPDIVSKINAFRLKFMI
jgi:hypothetical protein